MAENPRQGGRGAGWIAWRYQSRRRIRNGLVGWEHGGYRELVLISYDLFLECTIINFTHYSLHFDSGVGGREKASHRPDMIAKLHFL